MTSEIDQLMQDDFHYSGRIKSPVTDVVVEVESKGAARYTQPDSYGRFVFDGLTEGDHRVTVFNAGFPERSENLSGPKLVHLTAGRCELTTLLVLNHR